MLRGSRRYWVPIAAGMLCIFAASFVGAVLTWILLLLAFGLLLDGATVAWERAGGIGNLKTHRQ